MKSFFKTMILVLVCLSLWAANIFAEPQAQNQEPNHPAYLKPIPPEKLRG